MPSPSSTRFTPLSWYDPEFSAPGIIEITVTSDYTPLFQLVGGPSATIDALGVAQAVMIAPRISTLASNIGLYIVYNNQQTGAMPAVDTGFLESWSDLPGQSGGRLIAWNREMLESLCLASRGTNYFYCQFFTGSVAGGGA